ncbi:MAG TPA: hypothetical protein VMP42_03135 [Actinomycetota bacterium]|nr:hypothetical protein [Actinomycetota bacterium]
MAAIQLQSRAAEEQVRAAIAEAVTRMADYQPTVASNEPGSLVIETGSVGMAYLAGGFRKAEKMPMQILVTTASGEGGTGISVEVDSRGTGGGFSGGMVGLRKQKRGEEFWLETIRAAIPDRVQG